MSTMNKLGLTLVLVAGFVAALFFALHQQSSSPAPQRADATGDLRGLVAAEIEPFFHDTRVQKILAEHQVPVKVARASPRDMAAQVAPGRTPDFFIASGVGAAQEISATAHPAGLTLASSAPFHTPMVIASWAPIARILVANELATPLGARTYAVPMDGLTRTMLAHKRWKDLADAQAYDLGRDVLVATADVRHSPSAAMYLALTGDALHGAAVSDRATAAALAPRLAELFKRQGPLESGRNAPFDDYLAIGMGQTPLAFIEERQLVQHVMERQAVDADMVLLYPRPTIVHKLVFLAANERAQALAELLGRHAELQRIAVSYGFRGADPQALVAAVQPTGLAVAERLPQVIDPPPVDVMNEMVGAVVKELAP